jgi:post-segregation antitoxin (ccd killing protein)
MSEEKKQQTRQYSKIKMNIDRYIKKKKNEGKLSRNVFVDKELLKSAKDSEMTLSDFIDYLYKNAVN